MRPPAIEGDAQLVSSGKADMGSEPSAAMPAKLIRRNVAEFTKPV
jgi:hypothetical protein